MDPDYESYAMDWLDTAGQSRDDAMRSVLRAQVYATLALVAEVKEVHDVLKGIEDSLDAITGKMP